MLETSEVELEGVCVHRVGNKLRQEGVSLSNAPLALSQDIAGPLLNYFANHFRLSEKIYRLVHPAGTETNAINAFSSRIFNGASLFDESVKIANHLYDVSDHPRIKAGDLYVVRLQSVVFEKEKTDALGFFKSDRSDQYIKAHIKNNKPTVSIDFGTRVKSFDKGAIVLNRSSKDGYRVIQGIAESEDTAYWQEKFLKVEEVTTGYKTTTEYLQLCRRFSESIEAEKDPEKKVRFLENSYSYFTNNEHFESSAFIKTLPVDLQDPFTRYQEDAVRSSGQPLPKTFDIAASAIKKQKRIFRSVIKLDGQIEIKITPSAESLETEIIERGYDTKRKKRFYKIYFNQEK